ncbi:MAG: hypothetical protein R6U63_12595 [Longimicrobiales bacterium]
MDDTETATHTHVPEPRKRGPGILWGFLAMVLAFGAGFGWQFYEASLVRAELSETQQELMVERLRVRLGQAAISAQAGNYEAARQRMSEFFTRLSGVRAALPEDVAAVGDEFLAMRDEIITGLSRSNPEFADVLYGMLDRFRNVAGLEEELGPAPDMERPEAGAADDTAGAMEMEMEPQG